MLPPTCMGWRHRSGDICLSRFPSSRPDVPRPRNIACRNVHPGRDGLARSEPDRPFRTGVIRRPAGNDAFVSIQPTQRGRIIVESVYLAMNDIARLGALDQPRIAAEIVKTACCRRRTKAPSFAPQPRPLDPSERFRRRRHQGAVDEQITSHRTPQAFCRQSIFQYASELPALLTSVTRSTLPLRSLTSTPDRSTSNTIRDVPSARTGLGNDK